MFNEVVFLVIGSIFFFSTVGYLYVHLFSIKKYKKETKKAKVKYFYLNRESRSTRFSSHYVYTISLKVEYEDGELEDIKSKEYYDNKDRMKDSFVNYKEGDSVLVEKEYKYYKKLFSKEYILLKLLKIEVKNIDQKV